MVFLCKHSLLVSSFSVNGLSLCLETRTSRRDSCKHVLCLNSYILDTVLSAEYRFWFLCMYMVHVLKTDAEIFIIIKSRDTELQPS